MVEICVVKNIKEDFPLKSGSQENLNKNEIFLDSQICTCLEWRTWTDILYNTASTLEEELYLMSSNHGSCDK